MKYISKDDSSNDKKQALEVAKQNDVRELEQFMTNGTVDDLMNKLDVIKNEKVDEMIAYAGNNTVPCKWDKDGVPIDYTVKINPTVIKNTFFKSIVPFGNKIPEYNAEKLAMVYDYYLYLITEVNDKIGNYPSSLTSFCKLAGITTNKLREYKNSYDIDMRNIVEKIYDEIGDENLSMAQLGIVKSTPTVFKLKAQHEMVEKAQPNINISYKEVVNVDRVNENIQKYKDLLK